MPKNPVFMRVSGFLKSSQNLYPRIGVHTKNAQKIELMCVHELLGSKSVRLFVHTKIRKIVVHTIANCIGL